MKKELQKLFFRIVGGCEAGHVPWYVFISMKGWLLTQNKHSLVKYFPLQAKKDVVEASLTKFGS